ncbi:30S ribosomal protein S13 [Candidatus Woesearchaeota archaeon]|nr:30S ribosomal protein S13 [Candidatus Woesearchaeota archaeon]
MADKAENIKKDASIQPKAKPQEKPGQALKHLVRILNTDIEGKKIVSVGLRKIKGVGFAYANVVCNLIGLEKTKRVGALNDEDIKKIEDVLKNKEKYNIPEWMFNRRRDYQTGEVMHLFTSDLDFARSNDIRKLQRIKSNRGLRHAWGLPVRGQRTKSNFRKNKGKALGVKKKKQGKK